MKIEDIKKVELHLHLDGSVNPETLSEIKGISLSEAKKRLIAKDKCIDLNEYLEKFAEPCSIMQTRYGLSRVSYELARNLLKDNVIYAEIRFAPNQHTEFLKLEEVVESVLEGLRKTELKANLILCLMRGDTEKNNKNIIKLAKKYLGKGVVGIDLAGAEAIFKTSEYKELFKYASDQNVPFTIHAGEADGPSSIFSALEFGATRIGHGVRSIEDKKCLQELKEKNILLEICPTSNVQTNVTQKYRNHPIKELIENGIKVSINTDNRTVSNVSLNDEYKKLEETFGFTEEDFIKLNENAINASFISEKEKQELIEELRK